MVVLKSIRMWSESVVSFDPLRHVGHAILISITSRLSSMKKIGSLLKLRICSLVPARYSKSFDSLMLMLKLLQQIWWSLASYPAITSKSLLLAYWIALTNVTVKLHIGKLSPWFLHQQSMVLIWSSLSGCPEPAPEPSTPGHNPALMCLEGNWHYADWARKFICVYTAIYDPANFILDNYLLFSIRFYLVANTPVDSLFSTWFFDDRGFRSPSMIISKAANIHWYPFTLHREGLKWNQSAFYRNSRFKF